MKKLLIFIPEFPVLTETFIEREVGSLVKDGKFDVTVISLNKGEGKLSDESESVTVYERLSFKIFLSSLIFILTKPLNLIKLFFIVGWKRPYIYLKSLGYAKIFEKYNPDIIYAHFLSKPSTIALCVSIILGRPLAITAHARDILEYPDLAKEKAKYAEFISICNENACTRAKELSNLKDTSKIKLIYHGLDVSQVEISSDYKRFSEERLDILSVGRLVEKKGHKYLIEASKILNEEGIDHKISIVGEGPLEIELRKLIEDLGLEENVFLVGAVPFEEVRKLLSVSDIFVLPNINVAKGDADGVPNTLVEAALVKLPIVSTDGGSNLDFLSDSSAVIAPQQDGSAIADGIKLLRRDKDIRDQNTENAYSKALSMFDSKKNIAELQNLLSQI